MCCDQLHVYNTVPFSQDANTDFNKCAFGQALTRRAHVLHENKTAVLKEA